jgi:hypothetical protein
VGVNYSGGDYGCWGGDSASGWVLGVWRIRSSWLKLHSAWLKLLNSSFYNALIRFIKLKNMKPSIFSKTAALVILAIALNGPNGFSQTNVTTLGGTSPNIPKFTGSSTIGNSQIIDNGTNVQIGSGTVTGGEFFSVRGNPNSYFFQRVFNNNNGAAAYSGYFATVGTTTTNTLSMVMLSQTYSGTNMMGTPDAGVINTNGLGGLNIGPTTNSQLSFWTANAKRMTITGAGNIGIGTSSPVTQFEVSQNGTNAFRVYANTFGDISSSVSMRPHFASGTDFTVYEGTPGTGTLRMKIAGTTGNVGIGTGSPTALLTVNGNTLIGDPTTVTLPTGYKLYVQTGILTEKLRVSIVNSTSWADYVFNKDYKLEDLKNVEDYIASNHHLPGVPSASDVSKEGIDMVDMDATLLKKIEELTLYVIEQNKKLEEQNKKIQSLETELEKK